VLQAESGEVGQVITAQAIVDTPLLNRNWVYMAQLTPGVVPSPGTRGGAAGDYEANGQRAEQNNYVLDGVDNNINVVDYMNGSMYAVTPPPDAVSEFKIQTADFSAELGHSAGSALNISIKSGTNQIHGDVWEYVRNTALNAKSWNALTIPPYHLNQFGGTLGLPVLKNRLFYFGDIQGTRIVSAVTTTFNTPTPLMRQGNFTELLNPTLTGGSKATCLFVPNSGGAGSSTGTGCTGKNLLTNNSGQQNVYNPGQINVVAQNILKLYPLPNVAGWNSSNNFNTSTASGQTFNNITENLSTQKMTVQWDQRLDWNISRNDQAYARYSYSHQYNQLTPPLGSILDGTTNFAGVREAYLSQSFMLSETHIFNPRLINEFRFGYNWNKSQNLQANYDKNVSATLGMNNMPFGPGYFDNGGVVPTSVTGIQGFGSHGTIPRSKGRTCIRFWITSRRLSATIRSRPASVYRVSEFCLSSRQTRAAPTTLPERIPARLAHPIPAMGLPTSLSTRWPAQASPMTSICGTSGGMIRHTSRITGKLIRSSRLPTDCGTTTTSLIVRWLDRWRTSCQRPLESVRRGDLPDPDAKL
jgi:hypothetical protein